MNTRVNTAIGIMILAVALSAGYLINQGLEFKQARNDILQTNERKELTTKLNACKGQLRAIANGDDIMVQRLRSMGETFR